MRFAIAVAVLAWAALSSGPAAADLYRWVDPATGSVKFSSYPPPWFGDPAQARRAPKVEVIPGHSSAPPAVPKLEESGGRADRPEAKPAARARPAPEPAIGDSRSDFRGDSRGDSRGDPRDER